MYLEPRINRHILLCDPERCFPQTLLELRVLEVTAHISQNRFQFLRNDIRTLQQEFPGHHEAVGWKEGTVEHVDEVGGVARYLLLLSAVKTGTPWNTLRGTRRAHIRWHRIVVNCCRPSIRRDTRLVA